MRTIEARRAGGFLSGLIAVGLIAIALPIASADESGISIKPHGSKGVEAGVDLANPEVQGWFASTVNPKPEENNFMTVLYTAPRLMGGTLKAAADNPMKSAISMAGAYVAVRAAQGKLDDDWKKITGGDDTDDDPKGFKSKSDQLQLPEDARSFKGALATRQSCQFVGQSTDKVKLKASFGDSGSSSCEIDTNEPEEESAE